MAVCEKIYTFVLIRNDISHSRPASVAAPASDCPQHTNLTRNPNLNFSTF